MLEIRKLLHLQLKLEKLLYDPGSIEKKTTVPGIGWVNWLSKYSKIYLFPEICFSIGITN